MIREVGGLVIRLEGWTVKKSVELGGGGMICKRDPWWIDKLCLIRGEMLCVVAWWRDAMLASWGNAMLCLLRGEMLCLLASWGNAMLACFVGISQALLVVGGKRMFDWCGLECVVLLLVS